MAFLMLTDGRECLHGHTRVTLFQLVFSEAPEGDSLTQREVFDKVFDGLPQSDYLYGGRLMHLQNTKISSIQRIVSFGRWDRGEFSKYIGEIRADNLTAIEAVMQDLWIIDLCSIDTTE